MRIPRHCHALGVGLAVVAAVAAALLALATASADPGTTTVPTTTTVPVDCRCDHLPPMPAWAQINTGQQPVAGKTFKGLTVRLADPRRTISWVECDATIGGKLLRARQQSFFRSNPHRRTKVICRWRIPPNAGGKELHLRNYGSVQDSFVVHIWPHTVWMPDGADGTYWIVNP